MKVKDVNYLIESVNLFIEKLEEEANFDVSIEEFCNGLQDPKVFHSFCILFFNSAAGTVESYDDQKEY